MSDDLRNRVALAVEGMDTSTVEGARAVADAALAQMGGVRVKPLVWDVVHPVLHHSARNILGKYICSKTNNAHNDRYMVTYLTPTASSETIGYIDGIEAAKAAAQADYEARILAAIEPAPVSVREAGERDDSTPVDVSDKTKTTYFDSVPAIEAEMKLHKGRE